MSFLSLFRLISKNEKLAAKRHPLMEQNRFMKIFVYIFVGFWAVYLMFIGFMVSQIDDLAYEIFDILDGGMILFLAFDFFTRISFQETPSQKVKPYKLLPVRMQSAIDVFLIKSTINTTALFWLFFWVPFSIFTVLRFYGFAGFLMYNVGWVLLCAMNGLWYLIWRTLARNNSFVYVIPMTFYAALAVTGLSDSLISDWLFVFCMKLGRTFCECNPLGMIGILCAIALLFLVNRRLQYHYIYKEIASVDKVTNVREMHMNWLDRFGTIGEYLKLEVRSILRNSVVRKQFLSGLFCLVLFCVMFAFTDVYDNSKFMECFICMYCFSLLGTITLTSVMCPEGNYIDFLMSRKESVLNLLKAKYYFNCVLLLLPLAFSMMPVLNGKLLFVEILGCMFFVSGCVFPFLFQQAVYNNQTLPLNTQLTAKGRNSKSQFIVSMVALFVPTIVMAVLLGLFEREVASVLLIVLGLVGTLMNHLWLQNIYKRFLKRRYANMDGFRNTKQ